MATTRKSAMTKGVKNTGAEARSRRSRPKAGSARKLVADTPRAAPKQARVRPEKSATVGRLLTPDEFLAKPELTGDVTLRVEGHHVALTNVGKLYWPEDGFTKGDLLRYYVRIADVILRHLGDRPAILRRHPDGIHGFSFYQHDNDSPPEFLRTAPMQSDSGRTVHYAVYTGLASLLYVVNLGTIAHNPWHARVDDLEHPDYVVLDLDPHGAPFDRVLEVALETRRVLKARGLEGYAKTSGSSGMHVYVPIERRYTFEQVADFAIEIATEVAGNLPRIATVERRLASRGKGQIYVDAMQNARAKSAASVYSIRAKPGATVSAPVTWNEVERGLQIADFNIANMPARIAARGDLFAPVLAKKQRI